VSLSTILEQGLVSTHFQPIIDLNRGDIVGYEGLTRGPSGTPLETPRALFAEAERLRLVGPLEETCWRSALTSMAQQSSTRAPGSRLFVNALPATLLTRDFERIVSCIGERAGIAPSEIVIEISEETRIEDFDSFRAAVSSYRTAGFGVAIDDAGAGHSGLQVMAEIVPDLIKIDAGLTREVDRHKGRRATIEALLVLARTLAIDVIAEGIEREEELATLRDLGVQVGQGYLLARPHPIVSPRIAFTAGPEWQCAHERRASRITPADTIGRLAVSTATVESGVQLHEAVALFEARHADGVVVVENQRPAGLVMKGHAYELLGRAYGRELYLRRPVELACSSNPLVVDYRTPLEDVSRLAMARDAASLYDHIIVTDDHALMGIVSVQRLLAAITDARVDAARNANPLTGLPGNAMIERELRRCMRERDCVALMHLDLDDFKAFNDAYGFHRGDVAITVTAELLSRELALVHGRHFLGHIGGDDFLAIVHADAAEALAARLPAEFDAHIANLYDEETSRRMGTPPHGNSTVGPRMTMSVAMAFVEPDDARHYAQLLDALSAAKRDAKQRKRDRRLVHLHTLAS
jgi:diguanylate cyclase (GGDEF)-like protein